MTKNNQKTLFTLLGIAALVALFIYLKNQFGGFGLFGNGKPGDGSGGSGTIPGHRNSNTPGTGNGNTTTKTPLDIITQKVNPVQDVATKIIDAFHKHKNSIGLTDPDKVDAWVKKLTAADNQASLHLEKFATDKIVATQLAVINQLPDDMFKAVVIKWKADRGYKSVLDSYIFKSLDRDLETADFINRAKNSLKIK